MDAEPRKNFQVRYRIKYHRKPCLGLKCTEAEAINEANSLVHRCMVVTILREGGDEDFLPHPDNKGKFFLWRIVK